MKETRLNVELIYNHFILWSNILI